MNVSDGTSVMGDAKTVVSDKMGKQETSGSGLIRFQEYPPRSFLTEKLEVFNESHWSGELKNTVCWPGE